MTSDDYFTLEMADAQLLKIKPFLENARKLKREIEMIAAGCNYEQSVLAQRADQLNPRITELQGQIDHIEGLGAYLVDLDDGIIHFLMSFEYRDVFLCFKLFDGEIKHWHETDAGCNERHEIFDMSALPASEFPEHVNCRCNVVRIKVKRNK